MSVYSATIHTIYCELLMSSTRPYLKTYTVDQLTMPWTSRGGRYWSLAEIHAPFLFLLSGNDECAGNISFLSADPIDLASMWRDLPLREPTLEWFEIKPVAASGERTMRRVSQVLRSESGKALVVTFASGDTFKVGSVLEEEEMKLVFPFVSGLRREQPAARPLAWV